jgi:hypothetical protein
MTASSMSSWPLIALAGGLSQFFANLCRRLLPRLLGLPLALHVRYLILSRRMGRRRRILILLPLPVSFLVHDAHSSAMQSKGGADEMAELRA